MIICVIDTNVLVKRVIPEDDSDVAVSILEQHRQGRHKFDCAGLHSYRMRQCDLEARQAPRYEQL